MSPHEWNVFEPDVKRKTYDQSIILLYQLNISQFPSHFLGLFYIMATNFIFRNCWCKLLCNFNFKDRISRLRSDLLENTIISCVLNNKYFVYFEIYKYMCNTSTCYGGVQMEIETIFFFIFVYHYESVLLPVEMKCFMLYIHNTTSYVWDNILYERDAKLCSYEIPNRTYKILNTRY